MMESSRPPSRPLPLPVLAPGTTFARHRILRLLGEGRVAHVYEAISPDRARRALKVLKEDVPLGSVAVARFVQEGAGLASIESAHVVRFFASGVDGGRLFIAMELVEGKTLAQRLDEAGGALAVDRAVRLVRQACEGVAAAHARGILHRHLCPENILVTDGDLVKVADLGSAKLRGFGIRTTGESDVSSALTMAPEYVRGLAELASDVYSMGLVLYEAIAGEHPIAPRPMPITQITLRQLDYTPPPLASLGLDVSGALSALIQRTLSKDPAKRGSMEDLADGLAEELHRLDAPRRAAAFNLPVPPRDAAFARTEPSLAAVSDRPPTSGPSGGPALIAHRGGELRGDEANRGTVLPPAGAPPSAGPQAAGPAGPPEIPPTVRSPAQAVVDAPAERGSTAMPVARPTAASAAPRRRGLGPVLGLGSGVLVVALGVVGGWVAGRDGPPAGRATASGSATATATVSASATATARPTAAGPRPGGTAAPGGSAAASAARARPGAPGASAAPKVGPAKRGR